MSDQQEKQDPFAKPAKKAAKKAAKMPDLSKLQVVVVNADGTDSDLSLEIKTVTKTAVIVGVVVPDLRTVKISGLDVQLDLNKLRKMPPSDELHGKPVSLLIAAAELA